ncbi:IS605 OrfB family transposase [Streptomyces sp. SLBN-31]|nr:IS605 OrfB family transposase [Streptomyces sp. SLBN-31]
MGGKATNDQWALARRGQAAELAWLRREITRLQARLARPVGAKADRRHGLVRGCATRSEWHAKSRRFHALEGRVASLERDWTAGRVHVVRGGKRLAHQRHHLKEVALSHEAWRERWRAARAFLAADGETGKRYGNETIRVSDAGQLSIRLPAALSHLSNAPHCRYVLEAKVVFAHRHAEWQDRVAANRAVAYRIHFDARRGRWYLTASWQRLALPVLPTAVAVAGGLVALDMNDDHLAAWRLDAHGNPVGEPKRFSYDLSGSASHRDAQIRHALTRLLHHARRTGVRAVAIEDLDFTDSRTRESFGRNTSFRRVVSRFPTARLRARPVSMAAEQGITVVAVDPAYTSRWGARHWQRPLTTPTRRTTRHDAAAVATGRRALGHPIRRRTAPPPHDRRDRAGHRTVQAEPEARGREGPRPRAAGPRTRSVSPGRGEKAGDQRVQHHSGHAAEHASWWREPPPLGPQEYG